MALFGSTSPSFPIMASVELCADWMERRGAAEFRRLAERVSRVKALAKSLGYALPLGDCDPVRITVSPAPLGIGASALGDFLRKKKIEPEFAGDGYVVLLPNPFNIRALPRLERALLQGAEIRQGTGDRRQEAGFFSLPPSCPLPPDPCPASCLLPPFPCYEAIRRPCVNISTDEAVGRVSAQSVYACPPGVPLVLPGEVLTQNLTDAIKNYGIFRLDVLK